MNTELATRYINAKYSKTSREELIALRNDVSAELRSIKSAKEKVYTDFPGVHGRFQQSHLDVLDIREYKACAMIDNISDMIAKAVA